MYNLLSLVISSTNMATDHKTYILSTANKILSNPEALRKHTWKTRPCLYDHKCAHPSECGQAHFLEEYRIPICLFLEFCQKQDCKMYHPQLGAPQDYIAFMGINQILLPHQQWELKRNIFQGATAIIADKERLRQHLYKTRACLNGADCANKTACQNAHYESEYRIPICLFLNICEEKECKNFHPSRETKDQFLMSAPKFKYASEEAHLLAKIDREKMMSNLRPLTRPNPLAVPTKPFKMNTKLCGFAEKGMCRKSGCTFAHSLDELVINGLTTPEEKRSFVEKTTRKVVSDVFMRPSYKNSVDRKMEYDQFKFVIKMQAEENGEEYEEEEEDTNEEEEEEEEEEEIRSEENGEEYEDDQLNEVLNFIENGDIENGDIEMEQHKEEFLFEIEYLQMEELDDSIVVDTFYFNKNSLSKYKTEKFSWGDDDSDDYF